MKKKQAIETCENEITATVYRTKGAANTLKNMEQKKYVIYKISAARELENMRMMKNQLDVNIVKNAVKCKKKHSNEIHMLIQKLITDLRVSEEWNDYCGKSRYARNITIYDSVAS